MSMTVSACPVNIRGRYECQPVVVVAVLVIPPSWNEDGRHKVLIRFTDVAAPLRWVDMEYFTADPDPDAKGKA